MGRMISHQSSGLLEDAILQARITANTMRMLSEAVLHECCPTTGSGVHLTQMEAAALDRAAYAVSEAADAADAALHAAFELGATS